MRTPYCKIFSRTDRPAVLPIRRKSKAFFCLAMLFICTLPLFGCKASKAPVSRTGFYFDTIIQITVYQENEEKYLDECLKLAEGYEKMLSPSIENSDIWNINHSGGKPVTVSDETLTLIKNALSYCGMTGGRIDLTIETINSLWDFHAGNRSDEPPSSGVSNDSRLASRIPNEKDIADALGHVDYHNVLIEDHTVTLLDPESSISLGFIAKGYIADKLKEYLLSCNVKSAIINLGGNLLAVGSKPDGAPFQFGIQKPFDTQGTPITVLSVLNQSAVSSGVYERYFYQDDVLYHHILDPASGYPIQNSLLSVTILSDSSMAGDALSTSCFVLGLEDGMALIESLDGIEAVFITDNYGLHYSSGLM